MLDIYLAGALYIIILILCLVGNRDDFSRKTWYKIILYSFLWPIIFLIMLVVIVIVIVSEGVSTVYLLIKNRPVYDPETKKIIAYKMLTYTNHNFYSPICATRWDNFQHLSPIKPDKNTIFGIHCTRDFKNRELRRYGFFINRVIVKLLLSGKIVQTEMGYKAEKAEIISWSYEDEENWNDISIEPLQRKRMIISNSEME